jgi:hypothetical protein
MSHNKLRLAKIELEKCQIMNILFWWKDKKTIFAAASIKSGMVP